MDSLNLNILSASVNFLATIKHTWQDIVGIFNELKKETVDETEILTALQERKNDIFDHIREYEQERIYDAIEEKIRNLRHSKDSASGIITSLGLHSIAIELSEENNIPNSLVFFFANYIEYLCNEDRARTIQITRQVTKQELEEHIIQRVMKLDQSPTSREEVSRFQEIRTRLIAELGLEIIQDSDNET